LEASERGLADIERSHANTSKVIAEDIDRLVAYANSPSPELLERAASTLRLVAVQSLKIELQLNQLAAQVEKEQTFVDQNSGHELPSREWDEFLSRHERLLRETKTIIPRLYEKTRRHAEMVNFMSQTLTEVQHEREQARQRRFETRVQLIGILIAVAVFVLSVVQLVRG